MFPTLFKSRVSHAESYPVGAQEISMEFADMPQASFLGVVFCRHESLKCYGSYWGRSRKFERNYKRRAILRALYSRRTVAVSTPNQTVERGGAAPKWELWVWSVQRQYRHKVRELLAGGEFTRVRDWLTANQKLDGKIADESFTVLFDEEKETLHYE